MQALTKEWIAKADGDWRVARRESKVTHHPNYDAICFHCQQCAEKYLKAYLQERTMNFPRTHDLKHLLGLCNVLDGMFVMVQEDLRVLDGYSVAVRYPGDTANKDEAQAAVKAMERARKFVRRKLGLR
jgi:HEPN domain-containing protein